jgi:hypothetical protein
MPEAAKGPRLWLRRERRDRSGAVTHKAMWFIRDDGRYQEGTGCCVDDRERAVRLLAEYIARKRLDEPPRNSRDPAAVPVADVIARYVRDVAAKRARPKEAGQRAKALLAFFGDKTLADINGDCCRQYATQRATDAAARRELEDLRAAINHHRREGLCSQVVEVVLPPERPARERWLTRSEAARLLHAAWRYREVQKGKATDRKSRQHVAKFILVALYTGTRDGRVAGPGARSDLRGRAGAGHRCGTRCRTITGFGVAASTLRPILGIGACGRRGRVRAPLLIADYLNRTVWGRHIRRGDI